MTERSIVIFGAGKIGRSFIGQLFGQSGYSVIFIDVDNDIVDLLNREGSYPVVIKDKTEKTIVVRNVRAVSAFDTNAVKEAIAHASIMSVSVGKNALEKILPLVAEGLILRNKLYPNRPLDIIIAENMRSAGPFIRAGLNLLLPEDFPADRMVGLVETSIGKMVPIMTKEELIQNPLAIYAEAYNTLILDKKGFRGPVPEVAGLSPKDNMAAWVDRKAFIHNMGHAASAYLGNFHHPHATYIYEVLADRMIYTNVRLAMVQSADILQACYPGEFTKKDLEVHIDDLLERFQNRALKDTIFRVGQDISRKLSIDDRFAGVIKMAIEKRLKYDRILKAMTYGFFFRKADENGNINTQDELFLKSIREQGTEKTLEIMCGYNFPGDQNLMEEIDYQYMQLKEMKEKINS